MNQHILLMTGKVIPLQTLRSLTAAKINSDLEMSKRDDFDQNIKKIYGTYMPVPLKWINERGKDNDGAQ